jgi:hypothetical protein
MLGGYWGNDIDIVQPYTKYSKLYSFSQPKKRDPYGEYYNYDISGAGFLGTPSDLEGIKEPGVSYNPYAGFFEQYDLINKRGTKTKFTTYQGLAEQYINDFDNMVEGVNKYSGFYIGRYEISGTEEKATVKPGKVLDGINWYEAYNACMTFDNQYIESGMIYGALWDATMQWLMKSGYQVGYTGEDYNGWGIYLYEDVIIKNGKTRLELLLHKDTEPITGRTSYSKSNNIYDLSGNCEEWVPEVSNFDRVLRGGTSAAGGDSGYTYAAARRAVDPSYSDVYYSSRPYFYIK